MLPPISFGGDARRSFVFNPDVFIKDPLARVKLTHHREVEEVMEGGRALTALLEASLDQRLEDLGHEMGVEDG